MIEVSNLSISFAPDPPPAVDGVTFTVARGTSFGLVG